MRPDLSRRNVRRLSAEYGLPEGAIREMLTIGAGTNLGDVVEAPARGRRWGHHLRNISLAGLIILPVVYLVVSRLA